MHTSVLCLIYLCFFIFCLPTTLANEKRVEVYSEAELIEALGDESVGTVVFGSPRWNFTDETLPTNAVYIKSRRVYLEGKHFPNGDRTYIDANQLVNCVVVTDGGELFERNMWVDDCFVQSFPYTCFSETVGGGSKVEIRDMEMSDSTCTEVSQSQGITTMLNAAKLMDGLSSRGVVHLDERRVLVKDTGWVPYIPPTAYWRLVNTTLSCTGNLTHDMPSRETILLVGKRSVGYSIALTVIVVAVTIIFSIISRPWWDSGAAHARVEARIAWAHGYKLGPELGSGRYGTVYHAHQRSNGKEVAIKVITIKAQDRRALKEAWRECHLVSAIDHPSCVRILNYYSVKLKTRRNLLWHRKRNLNEGGEGLNNTSERGPHSSSYTLAEDLFKYEKGLQDEPNFSLSPESINDATMAAVTTISAQDDSIRVEGSSKSLQVHIVMGYADQGTLMDAVQAGRFGHRPSVPGDGQYDGLDVHGIVHTALDVACGLAFLHQPTRRLVHRDISPTNILLTTAVNEPRGFRAMLSDFGLATVISLGISHRSSDAKGTLAYMPPELVDDNFVSMAVDIYSLGVLILYMVKGSEPFGKWGAMRVINHKLSAKDSQLVIPEQVARYLSRSRATENLLHLMMACTRFDPRKRPKAQDVVAALETILYLLNSKE